MRSSGKSWKSSNFWWTQGYKSRAQNSHFNSATVDLPKPADWLRQCLQYVRVSGGLVTSATMALSVFFYFSLSFIIVDVWQCPKKVFLCPKNNQIFLQMICILNLNMEKKKPCVALTVSHCLCLEFKTHFSVIQFTSIRLYLSPKKITCCSNFSFFKESYGYCCGHEGSPVAICYSRSKEASDWTHRLLNHCVQKRMLQTTIQSFFSVKLAERR